jgi:hypothetical protein
MDSRPEGIVALFSNVLANPFPNLADLVELEIIAIRGNSASVNLSNLHERRPLVREAGLGTERLLYT